MWEGGEVIGRVSFDETRLLLQDFYWGSLGKTRLVREETRVSQCERLFHRVAVSWIPAGETTMMNRPRTALLRVTAVAVAMMVLGFNAQARSVPAASQQKNYLTFLRQLARAEGQVNKGNSLEQKFSSLESTMNILKNTRNPDPRLARRIATQEKRIYNQEKMVFGQIQNNTKALLATETKLLVQYQALPPNEQLQVSNTLLSIQGSIQTLVVSERGLATPVR
jgi:hypothetical protein